MKKILLAIMSCIVAFSAKAENTVTAGTVYLCNGKSATFAVNVSLEGLHKAYGGTIVLPAGITVTGVSIGDICVDQTPSKNQSGTECLVGAISTTSSLFKATSGILLYVTITSDGTHAVNSTLTATLKDFEFSGNGAKVYPAESTFDIKITDAIVIDEKAVFIPNAESSVDVQLIRSFEANKYYTLILPFAVPNSASKPYLTTAFGTAPTVYAFNGVTYDDVAEKITLDFKTSAGMAANTPYIIKVNADKGNPVFASVDIKVPANNLTVSKNEADITFEDVNFVGTYTPNTAVPAGALYLKSSDAKLYVSQGGTKMKGTRAYMDITALGATFDAKGCILSLDGQETAIDAIDADLKAETWFDLNGRKLAEKPATKGVYINNGKKVVVK